MGESGGKGWLVGRGCMNGAIKIAMAGTQEWWRRLLGLLILYISKTTTFALSAFPSKYNGPIDCVYYFLPPWERDRVKTSFIYLDIVAADCSTDRIEIYDGFSRNAFSTKICNGNKIVEFISKGNSVRMTYIGQSVGKYRGFHAAVTFL